LSESEETYRRKLRSEKARAIVWFAVLAIIATVREAVHEQDLWNFPCNSPCVHLSLFVAPILSNWIYLWLGYGGSMLVYFSEDWFHRFGQQGRVVREIMRRIGNRVFLYFYPLTVVWFTATAEGSFLLPDWIQGYYWLAVAAPYGFLVIWTIEGVIGLKIGGKRGAVNEAIDIFLELGRSGAEAFGEGLVRIEKRVWGRVRGRPPGSVTLRSAKAANVLFTLILVIGEAALTWYVVGPVPSILVEVPVVTLYILVFALAFIGLLRRKVAPTRIVDDSTSSA